MTKTIATAVIVNNNMPPFRIPVHGWNRNGVVAWTAEQLNSRTFELIPWHRVESVTVTLGDYSGLAEYVDVELHPIYPAADASASCDYTWQAPTHSNSVPFPHTCKLAKNHQWEHVCIHCEARSSG